MPAPDADRPNVPPSEAATGSPAVVVPQLHSRRAPLFGLRRDVPQWLALSLGFLSLAFCLVLWWYLTLGIPEERVLKSGVVPSPSETFESLPSLWFDRGLTQNTYASLKRVVLGFGLAAAVGVPLGVVCGCFPWINAFFAPLTIFGRNIPIAALIPLTYSFFGIGEFQKVMFLFIACVAFVVFDTARAVNDVSSRYIDTAYTLGAGTRQVILKVLFPLALPAIFNSMRLLFGLAFGYIMLAEAIKTGNSSGGLGHIINMSERRGTPDHILLVLMIIPVVALAIDRFLFWIQRELFPYQYGGNGILLDLARALMHAAEDVKFLFIKSREYVASPIPTEDAQKDNTSALEK